MVINIMIKINRCSDGDNWSGVYSEVVREGFFGEVTFEHWYLKTQVEPTMGRYGEKIQCVSGNSKFFKSQSMKEFVIFQECERKWEWLEYIKGGNIGRKWSRRERWIQIRKCCLLMLSQVAPQAWPSAEGSCLAQGYSLFSEAMCI